MLLNRYLKAMQFTEHPFTKVSGEKEELLPLYFVEPRYFSEALGNAKQPKSYVIFGPRGGGKSAIRSMIEHYCQASEFEDDIGGKVLCITYDDFSALNLRKLNNLTLSNHIDEILKRGVAKLAIELVRRNIIGENLREEYRGLLRWYIDEYMSDLDKLELDSILKMLRSQSEEIKGLIEGVVDLYNTFISVLKLEQITPSQPVDLPKSKRDTVSSIQVMEVFTRVATEVGFDSVYVLVDKIDETEHTGGNAERAAKLVAPILTNIRLLELERCAFKFFLWDNIRKHFGIELRTDRITMKQTEWSDKDLEKMLEGRIMAYSLNRTSLNDLFTDEIQIEMKKLLVTLSYRSPRDMNRLMEAIFAEAAPEATENNCQIGKGSIRAGIDRFSTERSEELYPGDVVPRLCKMKKVTFTISDVAATFKITGRNDVDNVPDQSATNKARNVVDKWRKSGVIHQIESVTTRIKSRWRTINQYQIVDPRVVYLVNPESYLNDKHEVLVNHTE